MTYGGTVPTITPSYSGFVNGDSASSLTTPPSCSTTATPTSSVGAYPISCSGAADPNYSISYTDGNVVVGAAPLVVTASSTTTTYGTQAGAITPSYSGFLNGDTAASLTTQPACSTTATVSSPVGTYDVVLLGGDRSELLDLLRRRHGDGGAGSAHRHRLVRFDDLRRHRAGHQPEVTGLQNGEGASVLGGGLQCSTDRHLDHRGRHLRVVVLRRGRSELRDHLCRWHRHGEPGAADASPLRPVR